MAQPSLYGMNRQELIEECEHLRRQLGLLVDTSHAMALAGIGLSPAQSKVVAFLYRSYPRPVAGDALLASTGSECEDGAALLKVQISRIRKRLGWHAISTTYGMGYALTEHGHALCKDVLEGCAKSAGVCTDGR